MTLIYHVGSVSSYPAQGTYTTTLIHHLGFVSPFRARFASAAQGTYNVIKWRSYTADTFWAGLSSLLPAAAYSSRTPQGGCTLTRLPTEYRCVMCDGLTLTQPA